MQKVMIFCPMKAEAKLIASFFPNSKRSNFGYDFDLGKIIVSGKPGKEAIIDTISKHFNNSYIPILFGLAGSLINDVNIGDIFIASSVYSIDERLLDLPYIPSFEKSEFFTSSIPIVTADKCKEYNKKYKCKLVEMEGYYFYNHFKNKEINSYMIRIVSDTPEVKFKMPLSIAIRTGAKKVARYIIAFIKK